MTSQRPVAVSFVLGTSTTCTTTTTAPPPSLMRLQMVGVIYKQMYAHPRFPRQNCVDTEGRSPYRIPDAQGHLKVDKDKLSGPDRNTGSAPATSGGGANPSGTSSGGAISSSSSSTGGNGGGMGGSLLPVLVFIHGESFEWNSGNAYDGSVIAAKGHMVVITLNYRLGIFGSCDPYKHTYSNLSTRVVHNPTPRRLRRYREEPHDIVRIRWPAKRNTTDQMR
ncbi:neuroligin-4 [Tropilaelaps mercedesae]|uniref:Neuroligin-4 n=1 Tax=Tropilaelaps mercedesae TaxID=418985 RepID=A0A1V9X784_9ACAR|nr:neuroligin-4 [Tropilaelaps mercedesae]